jgi:hypothetical protein
VLQWLAPRASRDQSGVLALVDLVDERQLGRLGQAQDVQRQGPGVVLGAVDAGRAQGVGRLAEGGLYGGQESSPFRAASLSASTSDWMTASRSPSSTCMRLLDL